MGPEREPLKDMASGTSKSAGPRRLEEDDMQVRPVGAWKAWDPFTALARMDRDVDELVRRTWGEGRVGATFVPAVEVAREGEDVVVRFELPGVDVERDVTIEVERGRLVVAGERRDNREDEQEGGARTVLVRELRYGRFRREFALPQGTSPEQVEASYDAGILEVRVRAVVRPEPSAVRVPVTMGGRREAPVLEHDGGAPSQRDAEQHAVEA
jgi:HSP20 family protein